MNQQYPQPESAEAAEGTAAHWVAWELLANKPIKTGDFAPGGVVVTEEMIEGGELLCDTIRTRAQIFGMQLVIETPIACGMIHRHVWGTPDCWATSVNSKHIEIFDYKFGHRFVDEFWNPQGLCYLAGILEALKINLDYGMSVSFTVVQPRCFYRGEPVRTHNFKLSETRPHFNKLSNMAEAALVQNPTATTNDHCGDCPGRHACSALQLAAYTDAEYANSRAPVELKPAAVALELRMLMRSLDRLQARVDGLKEQTIANLRAGKQIPYFRAEPGYGRQVWKIPEAQIIAIGNMFGHDLSKPGVITPKQAEKAGVDPAVISGYSFTPSTGFRLVLDNPQDAPRTFGKIEEG